MLQIHFVPDVLLHRSLEPELDLLQYLYRSNFLEEIAHF